MRSGLGRQRWVVVGALALVAIGGLVVLGRHSEDLPASGVLHREAESGEAFVCLVADDRSRPAVARSPGLETFEPEVDQDPRCPDGPQQPASAALQVHDEAPDRVGEVTVSGRLEGDRDHGCAYLATSHGPVAVVWPRGTGADLDPPRITGRGGATLASIGSVVRLRGRYVEGAARSCGPVDDGGLAFFAGAVTGG